MRIASITMVGQFPHGIELHVRNLKWALDKEDHIFLVTLPDHIKNFNLQNDEQVTYISFDIEKKGFINFWRWFPSFIQKHHINPEWFLFMEEDIFFFKKPIIGNDPKIIRSYLPLGSGYKNIMLNDSLMHPRVWEGAQLFHKTLINNAIEFGINFSFVKETFLDKNRAVFEKEFGGKIEMSLCKIPDTMDEFGLYCALIEKTQMQDKTCAIHLRGPETLHRKFPEVYHSVSKEKFLEVQKNINYFDIFLPISLYYIVGLWREINHLDWHNTSAQVKKVLSKLLVNNDKWMTYPEQARTSYLNFKIKES